MPHVSRFYRGFQSCFAPFAGADRPVCLIVAALPPVLPPLPLWASPVAY
jgi:hypothetical protein